MIYILELIESIFGSYRSLLCINTLSFVLKITLFFFLVRQASNKSKAHHLWFLLLLVLVGGACSDSAWIIKLLSLTFLPHLDYRFVLLWIRIAWIMSVIQHQALAIFIENLTCNKPTLTSHQKILICISTLLIIIFFCLAFLHFQCFQIGDRPVIESTIQRFTSCYLLLILMPISIVYSFHRLQKKNLPTLLKKQFKLLIKILIIPHLVSEFLQLYPIKAFYPTQIANSYAIVGLSTSLLTLSLYFCTRKIMGLRFLNFDNQVQAPIKTHFIDQFKDTLIHLSHVTNIRELHHICQTFFKEVMHIPFGKIKLYIRRTKREDQIGTTEEDPIVHIIETFLTASDSAHIMNYLAQERVFIHDELDFTNFYEQENLRSTMLKLLNAIHADVFLPVYEKNHLLAYIVIERHARCNQFYSNADQDEMIVFASYLGNIINLLQNKSFDILIAQERRLQEELYEKHQEINQYKESLRSFLRTDTQKQTGIIFYKNRHFTLANHAAKELIDININQQEGHSLTKALRYIAKTVEDYKTTQSTFAKDSSGNTLVITAVPHLEQNSIIFTVAPPGVSDIVKKQIDLLKNPSEWDFLLYLETTKTGKLINQLIPGTGEQLLNFKIELLKLSLSKKAILLDMPEPDMIAITDLLHHISLRTRLYTLTIQAPCNNYDIAINLFGINPIFHNGPLKEPPILEQLNNNGTLLITNIHWLDLETQEYLADFIKYGMYKVFRSEQRVESSVRIICSSNQNIHQLVQEKLFSKNLYDQLKKSTLAMPSLFTLPETELKALTEGFNEQVIKHNNSTNFLMLSEKEKLKLIFKRPSSLYDLRNKVHQFLTLKSKNNQLYQETEFDPAYLVTDPELIDIARLGKQALKDQKIVTILWNKFNKNQNQIATFLGVNRSSVNRRVKEYNLH